jgi:hypothetical protein
VGRQLAGGVADWCAAAAAHDEQAATLLKQRVLALLDR